MEESYDFLLVVYEVDDSSQFVFVSIFPPQQNDPDVSQTHFITVQSKMTSTRGKNVKTFLKNFLKSLVIPQGSVVYDTYTNTLSKS